MYNLKEELALYKRAISLATCGEVRTIEQTLEFVVKCEIEQLGFSLYKADLDNILDSKHSNLST